MATDLRTKVDVMFDLASTEMLQASASARRVDSEGAVMIPVTEVHKVLSRLRDDIRRVVGQ